MDLSDLPKLIADRKWPIVAALLIATLIRFTKEDLQKTPTIPARWRPVVALGLGMASGIADAIIAGTPWLTALLGGLVSGLLPVSANEVLVEGLLGQRTKLLAVMMSNSPPPPPAPPAPPPAAPPPRDAGPPPGSVLMRRGFGASACAALLACAGAALCGCSAAPAVVSVATVVAVAATLAQKATEEVQKFVDAYFSVHADAALQAKIDAVMLRVKDGAAALAAIGNGTMYALEADYLQALAAFQSAYADALDAIRGLPMAQVVLQAPGSKATMGIAPKAGVMTLVAVSPSVFSAPAKKVK